MITLKPVSYYMLQGEVPIILYDNFKGDGIDLTIEEGIFLGSLEYEGLQGEIPYVQHGHPTYIKVHPFVEACFESMLAEVVHSKSKEHIEMFANMTGETLEETKERMKKNYELSVSIIEKLGVPTLPIIQALRRGHGIN